MASSASEIRSLVRMSRVDMPAERRERRRVRVRERRESKRRREEERDGEGKRREGTREF